MIIIGKHRSTYKQIAFEQNMTLEGLGNKVGVDKSTVRKWGNGTRTEKKLEG